MTTNSREHLVDDNLIHKMDIYKYGNEWKYQEDHNAKVNEDLPNEDNDEIPSELNPEQPQIEAYVEPQEPSFGLAHLDAKEQRLNARIDGKNIGAVCGNRTHDHTVDGSSNPRGSGAGILLEDGQGVTFEHSLTFTFPTSNNQAEYEACIAGLQLAKEVGAHKVLICSDSQLAVSQITGAYQTKDTLLGKYLLKVKELMADFDEATIQHVPRESNARADILSKLASTKCLGNNRSVIQGTVYHPRVMAVEQVEILDNWMGPFIRYILHGNLPSDSKEKQRFLRCCSWYTLVRGTLYRWGFTTPLLKCLDPEREDYVLREVHEGSCGHPLGAASLAKKVLRAGCYWPTMEKDATDLTRKCTRCQLFADFHKAPPEELTITQAPWPFCRRGMDILGPFPQATGQLNFLIVAIDYFTKWIQAEALATITSANIQKFTWRSIITRFGIPSAIVTDNGTQFADRRFQELLSGLCIKQHFTSVEHPRTNGQAEAPNKVILKGIKKRLDESKANWPDQLHHVLWAYRTTPHSTTGESPFNLTYSAEAMIPVETGEPTWRILQFNEGDNRSLLRNNLDEVEEIRERARLREEIIKKKTAAKVNSSVIPSQFPEGTLVLRRADIGRVKGKLGPNWEARARWDWALSHVSTAASPTSFSSCTFSTSTAARPSSNSRTWVSRDAFSPPPTPAPTSEVRLFLVQQPQHELATSQPPLLHDESPDSSDEALRLWHGPPPRIPSPGR
ncbi:PREDICTED: uncharacterized protein LOC109340679 [Lupinus angustifolius]|uniref:uncharacterized protein LOC109340679 n=1 Tax=Lupinus angustifolius TaxID=3871 RepID=UPI00092E38ED|nr:PREDICTED: uncharacterized protein LOC109340679 [Lupinus angustifolius]